MKSSFFKFLSIISLSAMCVQAHAFKVGIAMPTQNEDRWYAEGLLLDSLLKKSGFESDLFYAGDVNTQLQQRQIKRMADEGCNMLVIGAVDCTALGEAISYAKSKGVTIISYDRLIMNTPNLDYYSTFDNLMVGELQGKFLVDKLNLFSDNVETKYIEIFYGSMDDNNAKYFYNGAMNLLQPYIDNGKLVVQSKQTTPEQTQTQGWSTEIAHKRMDNLIEANGYGPSGKKLDAVLSPADCISEGVVISLQKHGYNTGNMPIITGQDCTKDAIAMIRSGEMAMSIYKSPKELCGSIVDIAKKVSQGKKIKTPKSDSYDNGAKLVDTILSYPEIVDKDNVNKLF